MQIVTAAEAVAGIRSGEQLYLQCAAATPSVLLDALVARAPELNDVSVVHLHRAHACAAVAGQHPHEIALADGPRNRGARDDDAVPVQHERAIDRQTES